MFMSAHLYPRTRTRLGLLGAAVIVFAVPACGTGTKATDGDAAASATRAVTVTDVTGTKVEVPRAAKRVVALSEQDLDATLALGLKPVGAVNGRGQQKPPAYLG